MKICAIICEYNPFHNGHSHHIQTARELSGADFIICIMSGNFVQRGEASVFEKRLRAKHAVKAGANAVLELPVLFSTSNAELFAKGAVKILSAIPNVTHLCFGTKNANSKNLLSAAKLMNTEPKEISVKIKEHMAQGESYAKARAQAFAPYLSQELLLSPNNLLGVEYTKALLSINSNIQILPIPRIGSNYNDSEAKENFSSATSLRAAIERKDHLTLKNNLPSFVFEDLKYAKITDLSSLEKYAFLSKTGKEISRVCDCTEGLENAFKRIAQNNSVDFVKELTSARYTSSRIKRIALQNLLNIEETMIRQALSSPLYLRLLAADKNEELLSALGRSDFPLLVKTGDGKKLNGVAAEVFEKEQFADSVFSIVRNEQIIPQSPFF